MYITLYYVYDIAQTQSKTVSWEMGQAVSCDSESSVSSLSQFAFEAFSQYLDTLSWLQLSLSLFRALSLSCACALSLSFILLSL